MRFNPLDILHLSPLFVFIATGLLLVLAEAFTKGNRGFLMKLTVASCVVSALCSIYVYKKVGLGVAFAFKSGDGFMLMADRMGCFMNILFAVATAFTAMIAAGHQKEHEWENGEFYGILLLAAAGMSMLAFAADFMTVFLGIETMSIAAYVLIALRRKSLKSSEGSIKYFLMGAFATGFLLYGIALIYGATGTTSLLGVRQALAEGANAPLAVIGVLMLVIAFGFKVAAAPFHMWAPDAYEGAPSPVTGYMASAIKAAAFIAMIRVFDGALGGEIMPFGRMGWASMFAILAAITMTLGNIAALRQRNIKRMLAYSSISHAGILLVGVVALGIHPQGQGKAAVLYYLAAYTLTTLGAFAIISYVGSRGRERLYVDDWAGLANNHPAAALAMTLCLLSLGGMPPTGGFFAKFYVLKAGMEIPDHQYTWLVILGAMNSVISIFYYLRVVMAMYFREPSGQFKPIRSSAIVFVAVLCALIVLQMGITPGLWLGLTGS